MLSIADRVTFLGPVAPEGVNEAMQRADVFVVSSFMEGVPVVLMEAMAVGVPVIATGVGGMAELVEHGVNGFVVRPGVAAALVDALRAVQGDPEAAARRARAGRATIEDEFDIRKTAPQVRALLERYAP